MALNGTFDSRAVTTLEADNRGYLKAVAQIRREEEKAERARDAAIARTLEKQGKLTEATFATAKAAVSRREVWPDRCGRLSPTSTPSGSFWPRSA